MPPNYQKISQIPDTVQKLMTGKVGKSRQRAIATLAKKHGISREDARFHQAIRIAQAMARK